MNEYKEKIVCKCGKIHLRDVEVMQTKSSYLEMDQPLNIIIIKKFKCNNCGEDKIYNLNIVKAN